MLRIQHQHLRATTTIAASRMATGLFAANGLVSDSGSGRGGPKPGHLGCRVGRPGKRPYGPFPLQTARLDARCGE